jgi:hypothetical protein
MFAVAGGAGISAALTHAVLGAADRMDALADTAQAVGMTTEQYQILSAMLRGIGADAEKASASLGQFTQTIYQAIQNPESDQGKILKELGVDAANAEGEMRGAYDVFMDIRDALDDVSDEKVGAIGKKLFGENAADMIDLLKTDDAEIQGILRRALAAGTIVSDRQTDLVASLVKARAQISEATTGIVNKLAIAVAPQLKSLMEAIAAILRIYGNQIAAGFARILSTATTFASNFVAVVTGFDRLGAPVQFTWLISIRDGVESIVSRISESWPRLRVVFGQMATFAAVVLPPAFVLLSASLGAVIPYAAGLSEAIAGVTGHLVDLVRNVASFVAGGGVEQGFSWIPPVSTALHGLGGVVGDALTWIGKLFTALQSYSGGGRMPAGFEWVRTLLDSLRTLGAAAGSAMAAVGASLVSKLSPYVDRTGTMLGDVAQYVLQFLQNIASYASGNGVDAAFDWIPRTVEKVETLAGKLGHAVEAFAGFWSAVGSYATGGQVPAEYQGLADVLDRIGEIVRGIGDLDSTWVGQLLKAMRDFVSGAFNVDPTTAGIGMFLLGVTGLGRTALGVMTTLATYVGGAFLGVMGAAARMVWGLVGASVSGAVQGAASAAATGSVARLLGAGVGAAAGVTAGLATGAAAAGALGLVAYGCYEAINAITDLLGYGTPLETFLGWIASAAGTAISWIGRIARAADDAFLGSAVQKFFGMTPQKETDALAKASEKSSLSSLDSVATPSSYAASNYGVVINMNAPVSDTDLQPVVIQMPSGNRYAATASTDVARALAKDAARERQYGLVPSAEDFR